MPQLLWPPLPASPALMVPLSLAVVPVWLAPSGALCRDYVGTMSGLCRDYVGILSDRTSVLRRDYVEL